MTYTLTETPDIIVRDEDQASFPPIRRTLTIRNIWRGSTRATSQRPTSRRQPHRRPNAVAETLTANYGWTKPDPGASANTWGDTLNKTTDKIDAQAFVNQQAACRLAQARCGSRPRRRPIG